MTPASTPGQITRALLDAFVAKDRAAAERLIAPGFRFTSPYDNGIDRDAYFALCWPNSAGIQGFEIVRLTEDGDTAVVTYAGAVEGGRRFRNTEVLTCKDGQAVAVEVYFGWNVPHDVSPGEHRSP